MDSIVHLSDDSQKLSEDSEFLRVLTELGNNEFSLSRDFNAMNLAQIGDELTKRGENPPQTEPELANYNRCIELYCLALMEFEKQKTPLPSQSLREIIAMNSTEKEEPEISFELASEPQLSLPEIKISTTPQGPMASGLPIPNLLSEQSKQEGHVLNEPPSPALSSYTKSEIAQNYLAMADYLDNLKEKKGTRFSELSLDKLIDLSLCFSVEAEVSDRLKSFLGEFWLEKKGAIQALVEWQHARFDLKSSIKRHLNQLASEHEGWLMDGKLPYGQLVTALKKLAASTQLEEYRCGLVEAGALIWFFGQTLKLEDVYIHNKLNIDGLTRSEVTEILFRLSRLHRYRSLYSFPTFTVSEEKRLTLQEDVHALIVLLSKIPSKDKNPEIQAA